MNIFAIDHDPILSANLPDKLVVKMVLETAQLLSTVLQFYGANFPWLYNKTHINHPCSIWARRTCTNFEWLCNHGLALSDQYTKRYEKIHKSSIIIENSYKNINFIPSGKLTSFVLAMPDEYKENDAHISYRKYLKSKPYFINGWKKSIKMPSYSEWI